MAGAACMADCLQGQGQRKASGVPQPTETSPNGSAKQAEKSKPHERSRNTEVSNRQYWPKKSHQTEAKKRKKRMPGLLFPSCCRAQVQKSKPPAIRIWQIKKTGLNAACVQTLPRTDRTPVSSLPSQISAMLSSSARRACQSGQTCASSCQKKGECRCSRRWQSSCRITYSMQ